MDHCLSFCTFCYGLQFTASKYPFWYLQTFLKQIRSCHGRVVLDLLSVQSVLIITKAVSSNPAEGEVYSIQHYVIKFASDLRQVGGFHWVLRFPPSIKLCYKITEILLKVALNTIILTLKLK